MKRSSWKKSFINYLLICKLQKKRKKLKKIKKIKRIKIKKINNEKNIGLKKIINSNKKEKEIKKFQKRKKKKLKSKNKTFLYIMERNSTILPKMVGKTYFIHTGKIFVKLQIKKSMVGFKFGSFVLTRQKYIFKK